MRDSRFLCMDNSLIAEAVSSFCAPPVSSNARTGLISPSSELLDKEEEDGDLRGGEDDDCWGGEEGYFPYPLGDSPLPLGPGFDEGIISP
jgi:hypothetical protein